MDGCQPILKELSPWSLRRCVAASPRRRVIVPGFGEGGAVVYKVKDGKLTLKTVLEWIEPE
jgi:hypothetical protein